MARCQTHCCMTGIVRVEPQHGQQRMYVVDRQTIYVLTIA
jgi:hypothetical protein